MTASSEQISQRVLLTSAGRAWSGLAAEYVHIPRGLSRIPASDVHRLGIHFGPAVNADCHCDGRRMIRVQKPGDIDVIPAGVDGSWEDDADCRILRLRLDPARIEQVAGELGRDAGKIALQPVFQLRDAGIEAICRAIKADLEADIPSDPLYIDLLANALAIRLIETASGNPARAESRGEQKLSGRQLRMLTEYIETHLEQRLHLSDLATVAGVSLTRLKVLFRNATGMPVHQYVIRRRVEHARALMTTTDMAASEIALASGFAHQSHMATTMRRLTGQTPGEILREAGEFRPKLQNSD